MGGTYCLGQPVERQMRELFLCLFIFALAVVGFYFLNPDAPIKTSKPMQQEKLVFEPNIIRRNVTPDALLPSPILQDETLERLPAKKLPPQPQRPAKPKNWGRASAVAAGILSSGETTIVLADIDPIPIETVCTYESGTTWPCGMLARTEFRLLLRNRAVDCLPVEDEEAQTVTTRCKVGGIDMSNWLVLTGWAIPKGDLFAEALTEAKAKKRGQWSETAP